MSDLLHLFELAVRGLALLAVIVAAYGLAVWAFAGEKETK